MEKQITRPTYCLMRDGQIRHVFISCFKKTEASIAIVLKKSFYRILRASIQSSLPCTYSYIGGKRGNRLVLRPKGGRRRSAWRTTLTLSRSFLKTPPLPLPSPFSSPSTLPKTAGFFGRRTDGRTLIKTRLPPPSFPFSARR